jgi:purine-nucleoside phosphorylase
MDDKVTEAVAALKRHIDYQPQIGIILGSGLGGLVDEIENSVSVRFEDIPHFPVSSVDGHRGEVLCGTLCGACLHQFSRRH